MKIRTNDDVMKELLTEDENAEIKSDVEQEVKKYWGGKRAGAGRKPKTDNVLVLRIRVSEKEKEFIDWAREHKFNLDELMHG